MMKMVSLLTSTLKIHLNIKQNFTINTPEIFMSMETMMMSSLSNKFVKQIGNAQIQIPSDFSSNLNKNQTISLRVCFFLFK